MGYFTEKKQAYRFFIQTFFIQTFIFILIIFFSRNLGLIQPLEIKLLDYLIQFRKIEHNDKVVIIGINEKIEKSIVIETVEKLLKNNPIAVGLVIDGDENLFKKETSKLSKNILNSENVYLAKKIDNFPSKTFIPELSSSNNVVMSDLLIDHDHFTRRYILSASYKGDSIYSIGFALARVYLSKYNYSLNKGSVDKYNMRFVFKDDNSKDVEIYRLTNKNPGSYTFYSKEFVDNDVITLINTSSINNPKLKVIPIKNIINNNFLQNEIENKIIIIGITNLELERTKLTIPYQSDFVNQVEIHAQMSNQIISNVLNNKNFIKPYNKYFENFLICFFLLLGILLGLVKLKNRYIRILSLLFFVIFYIIVNSISLIYFGYWLPYFSVVLAFIGSFLPSHLLRLFIDFNEVKELLKDSKYKIEKFSNQLKIEELELKQEKLESKNKLLALESAFNLIHNTVLQDLNFIAIKLENIDNKFSVKVRDINMNIRNIFNQLKEEFKSKDQILNLDGKQIDLEDTIDNLLAKVIDTTLMKDFPNFKAKIMPFPLIDFDTFNHSTFNKEKKRFLCLFIEELLINIGKHAVGVTLIYAIGKNENDYYTITIIDNGPGLPENYINNHSKKFINFLNEINGKFICRNLNPEDLNIYNIENSRTGTLCQLKFPLQ